VHRAEILKEIKILYVEDDSQAREELYDMLRRRAGKVQVAANGQEGLEAYEDFLPDIVLADLYMPKMGGIEMIRRIRQTGNDPAIIVISAVNEVETVLNAVDAGIDKYILKPIDPAELMESLADAAEQIVAGRRGTTAGLSPGKKQLEDRIRRDMASFIKSTTGKGPHSIDAFLTGDLLEVTIGGFMTIYEESVLDNYQNITIIEHTRELFYSIKRDEICKRIGTILERPVRLQQVSIQVEKDRNKLIFVVEQGA
jgi:CheY-like chemotaxis protein/uncharacterized protein YbcI